MVFLYDGNGANNKHIHELTVKKYNSEFYAMAPTKKTNVDYCRKYRSTRRKTKSENNLRDRKKYLGTKVNYMKFKENDRMRKGIAKEAAVVRPCAPFKHQCTKSRSLRKAENSLPKSPRNEKVIIDSLSKKFNLRIVMAKSKKLGRPLDQLGKVEVKWLVEALDRSTISYINPGKNDVYIGKVNDAKTHEEKRCSLWPLRDILGNGSDISDNENYPKIFGQKLSFSLFYRFAKGNKEYVYNNRIPHYTCLCELCKNAILISKGIEKAIKVKQVPTTPRSIVEVYS